MTRHPFHDELVVEVARWYREPTPEMGYDLAEGRFGWFNRPTSTGRGRGTVRPGVAAAEVDELVTEAEDAVALEPLELVSCAYFEGDDRFVFVLGTRLPFRHRGIGRALLGHVVHSATVDECRSVLINGDEGGRPAALYQRLGFVDEVHWRRAWTRPMRR